MQISQVTRIWQVTLVSLYFQSHLRLSPVFTRILVKSLAPATAFCLMETILFRITFSQEEKQNTRCRSIQICHQINYVWVCVCARARVCVCMRGHFESIFQHIAIVQSFDAIVKHRKTLKKFLQMFYEISFRKCNLCILKKNLLSNLTKWVVQK